LPVRALSLGVISIALVVVSIALSSSFSPTHAQNWAAAQGRDCPIKGFYSIGFDGCYHRFPSAALQGCKERREECPGRQGRNQPSSPPPIAYTTATPSQVNAAIICDIAAAAYNTKGQDVDFSKAMIAADLTFSLVTKSSAGASLAVAAIPVFANTSVTPSLDASRITSETVEVTTSIQIAPAQLQRCTYSSSDNWLMSRVITSVIKGETVRKIKAAITFVLTKEGSAGLKLNIVPISFGPQFSGQSEKTQKACMLFDFTSPTPDKPPSCS
jgi:hypothetical protein